MTPAAILAEIARLTEARDEHVPTRDGSDEEDMDWVDRRLADLRDDLNVALHPEWF